MRARVSWLLVLAVYLAFPSFQRERLDDMGFGEIWRMERADAPLTQALRSRWDTEATAFVFPWGHMIPNLEDVSRITGLRVYGQPVSGFTYPCYRELARRLLDLTMEQRSSLLSRVRLQESLGLYETGRGVSEPVDEQLQQLTRGCREALENEAGAQADLDLHHFLTFFLGRLLFATRGDAVHCRFLPLLEELDQVWAYLHLPGLRRGILERPGVVPLARRWVPRRDTHPLGDQLASLQDAIDLYPQLDVVWLPYLEEGSERAREQIADWEHRGRRVRSEDVSDDAYLQTFALKYGAKVYKGTRQQMDVAGEIASLWALLHSAVQDRERAELDQVRRTQTGASSSRVAEGSQSDLED
ncbi:hypothetical protein Taro_040799 [Colocasia esculenta]|uniref:Aminotransferase-like plant mobile domain-containing protein n=1 Tax=Colocasia esculenta TaxID=4460 RepID=A0A843WJX2_COLES|nr:hypothetical protein [Colocasia esculenta]